MRFNNLKVSKKHWIAIAATFIVLTVSISSVIYFSPYPPIKPKTIHLDDYSYAIDYAQYKVKKIMKTNRVPSIAVALIDDQEIIWQNVEGYADEEEKILANLETYYRVGSISKVFTAIEIMRLFEEGLLDLDSPITDFIPDFAIQNRFGDNSSITIRSLLQHRSGLPRFGILPMWYWDPGTDVLKELTESLKNSHAAYPVGYRFKYSNVGFDILGHIVELLRGNFFAPYMKLNLLNAIGMDGSTFLSQDIPLTKTVAVGYTLEKRKNCPVNQYDIISLPSGNLYSTISDMAEFAKFIFRDGFGKSNQLIDNSTLQMMYEVQSNSTEDPKAMGLGWFTGILKEKEKVVYHSGGIQGTHSLFVFLPERKIGVMLVGNSYEFDGSINQFGWELLELMLETKEGIILPEVPTEEEITISQAQMEHLAGKYVINFDLADIYLKRNTLKVDAMGTSFSMIPLSESRFKLSHWLVDPGNIEIEFHSGDEIIDKFAIINYDGADYTFLPSYPTLTELPSSWGKFLGMYDIYPRNLSIYAGPGPYGQIDLAFTDNVLMLGSNYYLKPISDTEIIVLSGIFAYETMIYDPVTGFIYWQNDIFKPVN